MEAFSLSDQSKIAQAKAIDEDPPQSSKIQQASHRALGVLQHSQAKVSSLNPRAKAFVPSEEYAANSLQDPYRGRFSDDEKSCDRSPSQKKAFKRPCYVNVGVRKIPEYRAFQDLYASLSKLDRDPNIIWSAAVEVLDKMIMLKDIMYEKGIPLNRLIYDELIIVCDQANNWEKALELKKKLVSRHACLPGKGAFESLFKLCFRLKDFQGALNLKNEMDSSQIKLTPIIYTRLLGLCLQFNLMGNFLLFQHEMKEAKIRLSSLDYCDLLAIAVKERKFDFFEHIDREIQEKEIQISVETYGYFKKTYNTLLAIYYRTNRAKKFLDLRKSMEVRNIVVGRKNSAIVISLPFEPT